MDKREIIERLREKLDKNNDDFQTEWMKLTPSVLIGKAEVINATRVAYNELYGGEYSQDLLEYLLRFENPLEVVRDKWVEEQCAPDISEEMGHALWSIMDKQDAERDYELDGEYMPPSMKGVTM